MCGIFGIVNDSAATRRIVEGLAKLSYRGYDSAGLATIHNGGIDRRRAAGQIDNLRTLLTQAPLDSGLTAIGHTRWATHGMPTAENAHPHATDKVAVVHNGIIENHHALRRRLQEAGHHFESVTDSEVIPHLISEYLARGATPLEAVQRATSELEGNYAIAAIFADYEDLVIASRRGSPLAVGHNGRFAALASDAHSLVGVLDQVTHLLDGDVAILTPNSISIHNLEDTRMPRPQQSLAQEQAALSRRGSSHHTIAEIHQQPSIMRNILSNLRDADDLRELAAKTACNFDECNRLRLIACGTSRYAATVAKTWFQKLSGINADVVIASEFDAEETPLDASDCNVLISQSGETADTLAALRQLVERGCHTVGLVNVEHSALDREAAASLHLSAGVEVGVASTKAFTAQLTWLASLALAIGLERGALSEAEATRLLDELRGVPLALERSLEVEPSVVAAAHGLMDQRSAIFIGRRELSGLAEEAALKLTELSYIHAQGFASGELKHGPLALISTGTPVIAFVPDDEMKNKNISNVREVRARGALTVIITDTEDDDELLAEADYCLPVAKVASPWKVFPALMPAQLLAYHAAVKLGNNVDKPRNLAKSVTVE